MTWEMQTSIYYLIVLLQFDPEVDISTPSIGLLAQIWELINDWAAYLVSMEYFELNFKRNCVSDPLESVHVNPKTQCTHPLSTVTQDWKYFKSILFNFFLVHQIPKRIDFLNIFET